VAPPSVERKTPALAPAARSVWSVAALGETATLGPGDFIAFPADRPHLYRSLTADTQAVLILLYPAGQAGT
jgi:quercetin dioxygenase-like cupin family protein